MAPNVLISAERISRRFGYRRIFGDLSISISRGDAMCLIGPNGAGKTTLLRVLAGLLKPSDGTVHRAGSVSLVTHQSMMYDALTASENLRFIASLHGLPERERVVEELLERVGLTRWMGERVGTYSQGMRQRLALARGLLGDPDVLLLDEPLSGLDEPGCQAVLALLSELQASGRGLFLVTHQYERLASIVTGVRFLIGGGLTAPEHLDPADSDDVARCYRDLLYHA